MRQVLIKKDLDEVNSSAAELFVRIANEAITSNGSFSISLAGGSTPRAFYSLLASDRRNAVDWSRVRFFFGDERNVPPDSPESNYRMASETLLTPLEIDPHYIHRWRTEFPIADETAAQYEIELREYFASPAPRFDMILLGLGTDAHTASLFPNTAALHETGKLAVANWIEQRRDHRLTVTFPVINNAANVIFLVSGSEKAEAVANVLEGDLRPDEFPAQGVRPEDGDLYWLLDEEAAGSLQGR